MTDSPVQIHERKEVVQGQAQANPAEPHDGKYPLHEVAVITDKVILDANSDLAVQIPEGSGASTSDHLSPLGQALQDGTAEEQFARNAKASKKS